MNNINIPEYELIETHHRTVRHAKNINNRYEFMYVVVELSDIVRTNYLLSPPINPCRILPDVAWLF